MACFCARKQQIFAVETFCGVAVPVNHAAALRGRDVLWFVDNEASVSTLIRGGSHAEDIGQLALVAHL
eukprot:11209577-Lingulodinium_polyedra.AAC.1